MDNKIPLFKIYWDKDDIEAVTGSIERGRDWACGPNIEKFEELISQYIGRKYTVVFNSGTSALHALLIASGLKKDDEVIVPSFSFIATANSPLFIEAKPVFADIEEITYGLDLEDVKRKITPRTKAIIPMHYGGAACLKIKGLASLAKERNILLIEDAAESFGAKLDNEKVGTFGDAAMFSFCQTKVFTTGEGGCIVTDSEDIYKKLKLLRSHGRDENMNYLSLGYNFRMPDCIAALGISQIKKIDKLIAIRQEKAKYMAQSLSELDLDDLILPCFPSNLFHVFQEYHIKIRSGEETRNSLKKYLAEKGIGTRVSFPPIHLSYFYKNVLGYTDKLENTERISSQSLTLPLYPNLTEEEMDYIVQEIKNFYVRR
jgi:perosamine synthetase